MSTSLRTLGVFAVSLAAVVACGSSSKDEGSGPTGPNANAPLTWAETVEPILQQRCQNCHREGGIAPFTLMTYEDFKGVAEAAKIKITSREMPPWGAFDDEACKHRLGFKDDLRMTDQEIQKIVAWMDAGMPQGDMAKRPAPKTFGASNLADKTHTLKMAAPHEIREGTSDDIRCFPIDPGFTADTWVGGVNVIPGDPRVVHHVIVYTDPDKESVKKAAGNGSYPCFGGPGIGNPELLLAWAPGVPPTTYGDDVGIKVAKGSNLVMQVHYHSYEKTISDQTSFEIKVLPTKPSFIAQILLAGNASSANDFIKLLPGPNDPPSGPAFVIPSNVKDHTESMVVTIPKTVQGGIEIPTSSIYSIGSHMHLTGVDMKIEIERAAPTEDQPAKECLLGTPKYDFNWQRGYQYDAPLEKLPTVAGGDTLKFSCKYDNTMGNRHVAKALKEKNMSVPPEVKLGEETFDEMCLGAIVLVRRATAIDL